MKCDELKERWFEAYPVEGDQLIPIKVYGKNDTDEAIAELKAENRKLKRALWLARAETLKFKEMYLREQMNLRDYLAWDEVFKKKRTYDQYLMKVESVVNLCVKLRDKYLTKSEEFV